MKVRGAKVILCCYASYPFFKLFYEDFPDRLSSLSLSSATQTGLKKFLEYVQLGTSDKVARLLDKGLDPNYHDSDSGGRERAAGWGALGGLGSQGR